MCDGLSSTCKIRIGIALSHPYTNPFFIFRAFYLHFFSILSFSLLLLSSRHSSGHQPWRFTAALLAALFRPCMATPTSTLYSNLYMQPSYGLFGTNLQKWLKNLYKVREICGNNLNNFASEYLHLDFYTTETGIGKIVKNKS
jgi:hypothetical protein